MHLFSDLVEQLNGIFKSEGSVKDKAAQMNEFFHTSVLGLLTEIHTQTIQNEHAAQLGALERNEYETRVQRADLMK